MAIPSIGDILILSQTAWKIGRAFTAGRKNAPPEFLEVEAEINGLAKALKLLAETLFAESDSGLRQADEETQDGVAVILGSCQQTIHDLDSLMDQYQVIKKTRTQGGFAIDRSWSDLVVSQYQTMIWTTDGGNIKQLRRLLQMHTSVITLTKQALQSKDVERLAGVVRPMAQQSNYTQQKTGILGQQLDEANRIVKEMARRTSQSRRKDPEHPPALDASQQTQVIHELFSAQEFFPPRQSSKMTYSPSQAPRSPDLSHSPGMSSTLAASPPYSSMSSPTIAAHQRVSEFNFGRPGSRYSGSFTSSDGESTRDSSIASHRHPYLSRQPSFKAPSSLRPTPELCEPRSRPDSAVLSGMLPPPAMDLPRHPGVERTGSISNLSLHPPLKPGIIKLHRSSTTSSQKEQFEKAAFRNSAILCDVRGTEVSYAQKVSPDEESHDVEMVEACTDCRIAVVRKREAPIDSKQDVKMMTSIWVFSDDNTVRLELKMADGEMYVPYSYYFAPEKVSVTVPCELKFHDVKYGQRVLKTAKTTWINYVFESNHAAVLFQNELMGRTLLGTFRTSKTLRIHEGISGAFAYAEQMCGMENLRVWEDNDTLAVIAMIHFSPQFRNGYLAFYLNSANAPIRLKDEGGRELKVKGLKVPLEKGAGRKDSAVVVDGEGKIDRKRMVTGAKIEFASEAEKREFIALVRDVQRDSRELPDLSGVN